MKLASYHRLKVLHVLAVSMRKHAPDVVDVIKNRIHLLIHWYVQS